MSGSWRAAQARADHWGLAAKICLEKLAPLDGAENLGFVYVTAAFADDLSSIVTYLRETTAIGDWVGAVGHGVFGPEGEIHQGRGLVLMTGRVAAGQARLFAGFDPDDATAFRDEHGDWLDRQATVSALVHGDPRDPRIGRAVRGLAESGRAFLVGGLTVERAEPSQVSGRLCRGGLSGVLLGGEIVLATGLAQGCIPIGASHRITEAVDNVVMRLDGRPALSALKTEAGDIIARDLKRAAGYIHVARPVEGSDSEDYMVRGLLAIDPGRGWLEVGERVAAGERLLFVRRDPKSAETDFKRMLDRLAARLGGRTIKAGLYISCVSRGPRMVGQDGYEIALIHRRLGDFPLVGFSAGGEISGDRLYGFTGVLALILQGPGTR